MRKISKGEKMLSIKRRSADFSFSLLGVSRSVEKSKNVTIT